MIAKVVSTIPSDLCYSFAFVIASAFIVLSCWRKEEEESQKIDDLPVLATCRSGTLAILSSKVNGPVAHGST